MINLNFGIHFKLINKWSNETKPMLVMCETQTKSTSRLTDREAPAPYSGRHGNAVEMRIETQGGIEG